MGVEIEGWSKCLTPSCWQNSDGKTKVPCKSALKCLVGLHSCGHCRREFAMLSGGDVTSIVPVWKNSDGEYGHGRVLHFCYDKKCRFDQAKTRRYTQSEKRKMPR